MTPLALPSLHATHAGIWLAGGDGEVREASRGEAIARAAETPHIILNAPLVGQRLGYPEVSGLDLLELFAFLHPARFAVPTAAGMARVAGLEAVLADGSVISRMSGLLKDNAGYDLPGLLVGSEGTLGIVTAVRWRTVPRLAERVAALVPVAEAGEATTVLAGIRGPALEACDFFTRECAGDMQVEAPLYLLAEWRAEHDPTEEIAALLGDREVLVGDERLWRLREGIPERIQALGTPVKLDVGVPLGALERFLETVPRVCGDARAFLFGHLGDGNVHVNLVGDAPDADAVLALVLELGGTISAEHGVGVAKAAWLERALGSAEVAAMRALKAALDPQGILNPGAVLP